MIPAVSSKPQRTTPGFVIVFEDHESMEAWKRFFEKVVALGLIQGALLYCPVEVEMIEKESN